MIKKFFSLLLDDPRYDDIKYDTLVSLCLLPTLINNTVQLQMAFALASGASPSGDPQTIDSPFCKCYLKENENQLTWVHNMKAYSEPSIIDNSLIALSKLVLKDRYQPPLTYSGYSSYMDKLANVDYPSLMSILVDKALINKNILSQKDRMKLLDLTFFFNGVPVALTSYYNTEGKFLADWLRKNCL